MTSKEKKEIQRRQKRRFLGKLDNFVSKEERNYEQKHLKAYLKGCEYFLANVMMSIPSKQNPNIMENKWVRTYVKVKQEYYTE